MKKSIRAKHRILQATASAEPSDAFYLSEEILKGTGNAIGLKPKQNDLLKTTNWLAHTLHQTRSPMRHSWLVMKHLTYHGHSYLETKNKILTKRLKKSY
jgi:hypothetical protein